MRITRDIVNLLIATTIFAASLARAHDFERGRPDAHAPISIMGDHTHEQGEWMFSYRFMHMNMDAMRSGDSDASASEVFAANYTVTPEKMSMDMHMFGVMYAPTDKLTLMAMAPYKLLEMDHRIFPMAEPLITLNSGSQIFTTQSDGFGDTVLSTLYSLYEAEGIRLHAGLGLRLPTGSISEQDKIPGPGGLIDRQLPASMQLGSGTFDVIPSLTFVQQFPVVSYGAQVRGIIRTHENHHDYRLGNQFAMDGWGSWKITDWISLSAGLGYKWEGELKGTQSDVSLNPPFDLSRRTVTTAFEENYGGQRLDALFAINFFVDSGPFKGNRLAVDIRLPVYQDLNGYQLETDWTLTTGWQFAF